MSRFTPSKKFIVFDYSSLYICLINCLALLCSVLCSLNTAHCFFLPPTITQGEPVCPSQETMENVAGDIQDTVSNILQNTVSSLPECGEGNWYRVVNLSAPSDGCPSPWVLLNIQDTSGCGKVRGDEGCTSVFFSTGGLSYSAVCGRITGRAGGARLVDALSFQSDIDDPYVDGVSITYSTPRTHIWTFALGGRLPTRCPCSTSTRSYPQLSYIGTLRLQPNKWNQNSMRWWGVCRRHRPDLLWLQFPSILQHYSSVTHNCQHRSTHLP